MPCMEQHNHLFYQAKNQRPMGHALTEGRRRRAKYMVVAMYIGGGQVVAALFEVFS